MDKKFSPTKEATTSKHAILPLGLPSSAAIPIRNLITQKGCLLNEILRTPSNSFLLAIILLDFFARNHEPSEWDLPSSHVQVEIFLPFFLIRTSVRERTDDMLGDFSFVGNVCRYLYDPFVITGTSRF